MRGRREGEEGVRNRWKEERKVEAREKGEKRQVEGREGEQR